MTKRRDVLRSLAAVGVAPGVPDLAGEESDPRVPDVETYGDAMAVICVEAAYHRRGDVDSEMDRAADLLLYGDTLDRWRHVIHAAARDEEWVEEHVIDEYLVYEGR